MTDDEKLALIEFVRNHASDLCRNISVAHFTDQLAWENDGDVDPLEIAEARGADTGATECTNAIRGMDCHAIFTQWTGRS